MIIFRGLGILVAVAGFAGFLIAEVITRAVTKSDIYYQAHSAPRLAGAVLAAALAFVVAMILDRNDAGRVVVDKATGQEILLRRGHSIFFIPVRYWPYIILAIGVVVAFVNE